MCPFWSQHVPISPTTEVETSIRWSDDITWVLTPGTLRHGVRAMPRATGPGAGAEGRDDFLALPAGAGRVIYN